MSFQQGRVLDPIERVSEALFGLIMVLTFTGSLSVANPERSEVRVVARSLFLDRFRQDLLLLPPHAAVRA